jgi:hypothetical protein
MFGEEGTQVTRIKFGIDDCVIRWETSVIARSLSMVREARKTGWTENLVMLCQCV